MKILTVGDGFAAGHIWPMWPQILKESVPNSQVFVLGKPAAGNEYIFNVVLETIDRITPDLVLVQWANSQRLDLILDNEIKQSIARHDAVYHHNQYQVYKHKWWLSNASTQDYVRRYHNDYIGEQQALSRTRNYIISLDAILQNRKIPYKFFSTYHVETYPDPHVDWTNWIWHEPGLGLEQFSHQERFKEIRGTEVQPSTEVHKAWVDEIILPAI